MGVDRHPAGVLLQIPVAALDVGQVAHPAVERLDAPVALGRRQSLLHVAFNAGVAGEIDRDELLRLLGRDAERLGETIGAHAVDEAEVDRLRRAALLRVDEVDRDAENGRRGRAVDVLAAAKRLDHRPLAGDVRQHAKLDLAVVRGDQE